MCMEHVINQKPEAPVSLKQHVCSISAVPSHKRQCRWQVDSPEKSKCRCQFSDEYAPFSFSSMHIHQAARPPGDFIPNCVLLSSPPKTPVASWERWGDVKVDASAALMAQTAQLYSSTLRGILSQIPLVSALIEPQAFVEFRWSTISYLWQVVPHQVESALAW